MSDTLSIAVIGAGFSGLCIGIKLKKAGFNDFVIFEKSDGVGGTWRDNNYPGCACDVPSFYYCFSFEMKPDWSLKFAEQPEILAYLEHCTNKYELRSHIRFNTEIERAQFDEREGLWKLHTCAGDKATARVLITGCGQVNRPSVPDIPELDTFKGMKFHSARWNHDYELNDKRVAVLGNGASAIQFVPHVASKVKKLTLFQRHASWILEKPDRRITPWEKWIYRWIPLSAKAYRLWIYLVLEFRYSGVLKDNWQIKVVTEKVNREMDKKIQDKTLREALRPDYEVGCKRILISNDFYDVFQRENVELVTSPIDKVEDDGLVTKAGERYPVDAIIFGTGFKTNEFLAPMKIEGLDGESLDHLWRDGAEAYCGITVAGFPNLFMLYGPNTNLAHSSVLYMIETQVIYITRCLKILQQQNLKYINVRKDAMVRYNEEIQAKLKKTVWDTSCSNWYKTASGKIVNNWPEATWRYRKRLKNVALHDYHLEEW